MEYLLLEVKAFKARDRKGKPLWIIPLSIRASLSDWLFS